jgi:hypothetical protein
MLLHGALTPPGRVVTIVTFVRDNGVVLKSVPIFWFHNLEVQAFKFSVIE